MDERTKLFVEPITNRIRFFQQCFTKASVSREFIDETQADAGGQGIQPSASLSFSSLGEGKSPRACKVRQHLVHGCQVLLAQSNTPRCRYFGRDSRVQPVDVELSWGYGLPPLHQLGYR